MYKKTYVHFAVCVVSVIALTAPAVAQDKTCLLEGSFTFAGKTTEIKDCIQNNGITQQEFTKMCSGLVKITAALPGGKPGTVTYMPACPANPQGSCEGILGKPLTSFYYKRDAQTFSEVKSSCQAQGGKWK